ncbi:hypothetical protein [Paraburkholderia sp. MM5477-R1]|uniref:hypothetical protein n=1 Tax=Paraburkholderia sp. MM5477-R1 TaxID=2991062 RepID=UPI003D1CCD73
MSTVRNFHGRTEAVTLSVRPCSPRLGSTHTYVLNGTLMRDVLVNGKWVTVHTSEPRLRLAR